MVVKRKMRHGAAGVLFTVWGCHRVTLRANRTIKTRLRRRQCRRNDKVAEKLESVVKINTAMPLNQ